MNASLILSAEASWVEDECQIAENHLCIRMSWDRFLRLGTIGQNVYLTKMNLLIGKPVEFFSCRSKYKPRVLLTSRTDLYGLGYEIELDKGMDYLACIRLGPELQHQLQDAPAPELDTSAKKRKRQDNEKEKGNKRPTLTNPFFLFRNAHCDKIKNTYPGIHTNHTSKIIGTIWREKVTREQKRYYEDFYAANKNIYLEFFPDAEFAPKGHGSGRERPQKAKQDIHVRPPPKPIAEMVDEIWPLIVADITPPLSCPCINKLRAERAGRAQADDADQSGMGAATLGPIGNSNDTIMSHMATQTVDANRNLVDLAFTVNHSMLNFNPQLVNPVGYDFNSSPFGQMGNSTFNPGQMHPANPIFGHVPSMNFNLNHPHSANSNPNLGNPSSTSFNSSSLPPANLKPNLGIPSSTGFNSSNVSSTSLNLNMGNPSSTSSNSNSLLLTNLNTNWGIPSSTSSNSDCIPSMSSNSGCLPSTNLNSNLDNLDQDFLVPAEEFNWDSDFEHFFDD
ncbi:hypothetical protein F5Y16DRAFT_417125 [Xylariaceae sp. FL0255]|nr:hypothetical protein F5Y16DRAFT_417125 [Xylariaceae sp. FL0255]